MKTTNADCTASNSLARMRLAVIALLCACFLALSPAVATVALAETSAAVSATTASTATVNDSARNMWRLYNPYSGEHLYTEDLNEAIKLVGIGWRWEGIAWVAPTTGDAVYRLYNPFNSDHHYTTSAGERDELVKLGWRDEGIGWYSAKNKAQAVLRQYNPYATIGAHNFTTSADEASYLVSQGWHDEGVAWYALSVTPQEIEPFWLDGAEGRQRILSDGTIFHDGYLTVGDDLFYVPDDGFALTSWLGMLDGVYYGARSDGKLVPLTKEEIEMFEVCSSVPSPGYGLCAAWTNEVARVLTGITWFGDACDIYDTWCHSSDRNELKPGMAIAVSTHNRTELGRIYGHVCIYVGGGLVMDNVGSIRVMDLDDWIDFYGALVTPRWGWITGVSIN